MGINLTKEKLKKINLHLKVEIWTPQPKGLFKQNAPANRKLRQNFLIEEDTLIFLELNTNEIFFSTREVHKNSELLKEVPKFKIYFMNQSVFLQNLSFNQNEGVGQFWTLVQNTSLKKKKKFYIREKQTLRLGLVPLKVLNVYHPSKERRKKAKNLLMYQRLRQESHYDKIQNPQQLQRKNSLNDIETCAACGQPGKQGFPLDRKLCPCCAEQPLHQDCLEYRLFDGLRKKEIRDTQSIVQISLNNFRCRECRCLFPKVVITNALYNFLLLFRKKRYVLLAQQHKNKKRISKYFILNFSACKKFTFGRNSFNDIVLEDSTVDKSHAVI